MVQRRFLWTLEIPWDRATRADARDFCRWLQLADKPVRLHWRYQRHGIPPQGLPQQRRSDPVTPNAVTGKPGSGTKYAATTRAHCETVVRSFYDLHLEEGDGPLINPFLLDRSRRAGRAHAHHNPMEVFRNEKQGRYRPTVPKRIPRRIPDEMFNAQFAALNHHRDRALLAFWVSTVARADELLTCLEKDALPGQQLIGVTRKGTRAYQQLPASTDAFVWLRLAQAEARRKGTPCGRKPRGPCGPTVPAPGGRLGQCLPARFRASSACAARAATRSAAGGRSVMRSTASPAHTGSGGTSPRATSS